MENYYKIQIGPQVLDTLVHYVNYSGTSVGYYSSVTAMMSGGTSGTSLFTGMTIPVLLTQTAVDCGFYSVFDGKDRLLKIHHTVLIGVTVAHRQYLHFIPNLYHTIIHKHLRFIQSH